MQRCNEKKLRLPLLYLFFLSDLGKQVPFSLEFQDFTKLYLGMCL